MTSVYEFDILNVQSETHG